MAKNIFIEVKNRRKIKIVKYSRKGNISILYEVEESHLALWSTSLSKLYDKSRVMLHKSSVCRLRRDKSSASLSKFFWSQLRFMERINIFLDTHKEKR
jgi:hypothetical protein